MTNDPTQSVEIARDPIERPQSRASFVRGGITAWNAYLATGLHVTEEEADIRLAKLEAGLDVAPPHATALKLP